MATTICDYEIVETAAGTLVVSVGADAADDSLDEIRGEMADGDWSGWTASFAGEGNTDAGGESTEDIHLSGPCVHCGHGYPYGHRAGYSCVAER